MKKTKSEIEAQLSLLRWLMAQPNMKTAADKAHKLLMDLQFDGSMIKLEKDDIYDADFLEFWAVYPRKTGKGDAWRKWQTLKVSKARKEKIIESVVKYKGTPDWKKENGQYIPLPATFLHQRRFDDEVRTEDVIAEEKAEEKKPRFQYEFDPKTNTMIEKQVI